MILAAGLSPAWQQIMRFDALQLGEVNRAAEVHWCASGKVINVALALRNLNADVEIMTMVGGMTGQAIQDELTSAGVAGHWVATRSATRVCTTLLQSSVEAVTELVENTSAASEAELQDFCEQYGPAASKANTVVLTGSLPAGAANTFYRDLLRRTPCPAILDFRGPELLAAVAEQPLLVKPNREELGRTFGRALRDDNEVFEVADELRRLGAQWVAVTDGPQRVLVSGPNGRFALVPPKMKLANPIGSGDCLAAAVAWGIADGLEMSECLRLGVAAAAENVAELLPARVTSEAVRRRAATVRLEGV